MRKHATLASVCQRPTYGIDTPEGKARLMKEAEAFVERAKRQGADIIAFPEEYPQLSVDGAINYAEPEEGGTLDQAREWAKKYSIYIIWPRCEKSAAGRCYNSAILIDRQGEVMGRYHKNFPMDKEMAAGIDPGTVCPIFQTDFGRIAIIICYDLNFIEIRNALREQLPDVVFFCSMYRGGMQCQEWALDLGCHFVGAIAGELGYMLDPAGHILNVSSPKALMVQHVNLNKRLLHLDYNENKIDEMLAKYGPDLTFDIYDLERRYVIGYEREDKDVDEIIKEFNLEPINDYFKRVRRERKERLAKLSA